MRSKKRISLRARTISKGARKLLRFALDLVTGTPGKGRTRAECWQRVYVRSSEEWMLHRLSPRRLSWKAPCAFIILYSDKCSGHTNHQNHYLLFCTWQQDYVDSLCSLYCGINGNQSLFIIVTLSDGRFQTTHPEIYDTASIFLCKTLCLRTKNQNMTG